MKLIILLALLVSSSAFARNGESGSGQIYPSTGPQDAVQNAERENQNYIDELVRREQARRAKEESGRQPAPPPRESHPEQNCNLSFWNKSDALRLCPPATAMKAMSPQGQAYYYCDCE